MNYLQTVLLSTVLASWIIVALNTDSFANEEVSPTAQQYLINLSMTKEDAFVLIEECRKTEQPNKCVKFAWAIRAQEWGYDTRHPFGMLRQPSRYKKWVKEKTTAEYAELRVWSFTRHRHSNNTPSSYLTRSKYCTSWCEHRVSNVTRFIAWYESGNIPQEGALPVWTAPTENLRQKAKDQEVRTQKLKDQYIQEEARTIEYRWDYIKSKIDNK